MGTTAHASERACQSLNLLSDDKSVVESATLVPASNDLPSYCRVIGSIKSDIRFEMRFPTQNWNGKFYMAGCGAFCGAVASDTPGFINSINYGLKRNYAVSTMDSGHSSPSKADGTWAHNNREGEHNWGHLAVTKTAAFTKKAIKQYYGSAQDYSYFAGCSTGGRMAAMEAYRYPDDFDGVIAGAPALNYTNLVATYFAWMNQHNHTADGQEIITSKDISLVSDHVYAQCDGLDGVEDGLISHPPACRVSFESLACADGDKAVSGQCLTRLQIDTLNKLYSVPVDSKGNALFAGAVPLGGEPFWKIWFTARQTKSDESNKPVNKAKGLMNVLNQQFLSYMAFENDPADTISPQTFDFDVHPKKLDFMAQIYNSDSADLSAFKARGGKMILWHGWSDMIIPPDMSIDYYERLISHNGGVKETQDFARFFLVPGMGHCGIFPGPGPSQDGFDMLTALEHWVEKDKAPETIMLSKINKKKKVEWKRPSCAYPQVSQYKGFGDPSKPESFICADSASIITKN